jgi:hypothetical protein
MPAETVDVAELTRFVAPKPVFKPTTNAAATEAMTPRPRDNQPAPSVSERVAAEGNDLLATLLRASQEAAKTAAKALEQQKTPRTPGKKKETALTQGQTAPNLAAKEAVARFSAADICSDQDFIIRTRRLDILSPEVRALFHANGGDKYLLPGVTFAVAFENLKREIMGRLRSNNKTPAPYSRHTNVSRDSLKPVHGMPEPPSYGARQEAERLQANRKWAGIPNE